MVAISRRLQVQDGQPTTRETKHQVWNSSQGYASFGVYKAEGGVMWRLQRANVSPPSGYPGREMASLLVKGQDCPLGEAVNGTEYAGHDGPGNLPG